MPACRGSGAGRGGGEGMTRVRYVALARLVSGVELEEIALDGPTTVGDVMKNLCRRYGAEFREAFFTRSCALQHHVVLQVDARDIAEMDGLDTPLPPESELSCMIIVPSLAGG